MVSVSNSPPSGFWDFPRVVSESCPAVRRGSRGSGARVTEGWRVQDAAQGWHSLPARLPWL